MSDCTDPSCGEHINCRNCGDTTNHAPDYFPSELDGLCPSCAVEGMESGVLPKPDPAAMMQYILGAISNQIERALPGARVEFGSAEPFQRIASDDKGATFLVRQCLN